MIIPVRCFACGKVLADKWDTYVRRCAEERKEQQRGGASRQARRRDAPEEPAAPSADNGHNMTSPEPTLQGRVLDGLGITKPCCRTVMLTHVELSSII